ncbi:hypothetical protein ACTHOQ_10615 [Solibacillus silvestris]|uniref:hypothetical protein n=1 Tax=Solibacillus silvestris TaxID=76853 RepID=UPI003F7FFCEB
MTLEDSTSYTLQEIEKLKLKISGYRNTLMTLKMGTSYEDFQMMKREFEALKLQLSYIEGLTRILEEKQHTQNEIYEEQVKQFASQIALLNQTIEEMGQEILSISNKLNKSEGERALSGNIPIIREENQEKKPDNKAKYIHNIEAANHQPPIVTNQPSYMQLRNLTNQVIQLQKNDEGIASAEHSEDNGNRRDQRYFNQHFFQPVNTQPNNNYNGLNKNMPGPTPFQFKSSAKQEDIQTSGFGKGYNSPDIKNETEKVSITPIADSVSESLDNVSLNIAGSEIEDIPASTVNESIKVNEVVDEKSEFRPEQEMQNEGTDEETKSLEEKSKKQRSPSFFNLFRK